MKIVFLNVWGESMRDSLVPYIEEQVKDTDIFCFQEASEKMRAQCVDVLVDYEELSDYKYISNDDDFPQSIYVKKSMRIVSSGTLFADDQTVGLATYVELKLEEGSMFVCNVHGRARPGDKMDTVERVRFSSDIIDFFKDKNAPVVIGGDFNLEPPTKSVGVFKEAGYRDLIDEHDIKTTRNHFAWDLYPGNELYYSDYVFVNDKLKVKNFEVVDNEVSDHLPLIVELVD
jgi:endonuclease/exonuclease/phosphatase family metal-dependent hydrolase